MKLHLNFCVYLVSNQWKKFELYDIPDKLMYLNGMNSFLAVQLEALWKVHSKMIVFKWIFLPGYIRKDFNYQTDALSEWREPNFQWKKKLNPSIGKNFVKYEREWRSLPGRKERGYLSITSIKWIYLSIFRSTKQPSEKRRFFFLVLVFIFIDRLWQLHVKTLS